MPTPRWRSCRPGFFLPVRVLSRVFRGKYPGPLAEIVCPGPARLPGRDPKTFDGLVGVAVLPRNGSSTPSRPSAVPSAVLKYLARYTHRVAISNHRLVSLQDGRVTFRYKDYADDHRSKTMTLSADEFLRRFSQHVLPKGFVKMRHYGLLANRHREERLDVCRRLLLVVGASAILAKAKLQLDAVTIEPTRRPCCPRCGSERLTTIEVPKGDATRRDTS